MTRFQPGDVIDEQYEVLARLGAGGFGQVFRCRDLIDGREYALKLLDDGAGIDRLRREYLALSRVDHPNVVKARRPGRTSDGRWFLLTDAVDGPNLQELLDEQGSLTLDELREIGSQLLAALCAIHPDEGASSDLADRTLSIEEHVERKANAPAGLLHRDIKPANVIISPAGLVLVDFGIASRPNDPMVTMSATPRYVPPDLAFTAQERWTADVDRYAAGLTLHQATFGILPPHPHFASEESDVAPDRLKAIPSDLAAFLARACADERARRFQSTAEMLAAWELIDWTIRSTLVDGVVEFEPWSASERIDVSSDDDLRSLILEVVRSEGPIRCRRLYRLVQAAAGPQPVSRLNRMVYRLVTDRGGGLEQVEPPGGGQQDKTVYAARTNPSVLRTVGHRGLNELPTIELEAHIEAAFARLGISDGDEFVVDDLADEVEAALLPEVDAQDLARVALRAMIAAAVTN